MKATAKEDKGIAGSPQRLEETRNRFSPSISGGSMALLTPSFWISGLYNYNRIHFSRFKPPSLRQFITAVKGNAHNLI